MKIAVKMIWGRTRCHVLGVKGHRRPYFRNHNFWILIADLDSLWKSMTSECASFFLFSDENTQIKHRSYKMSVRWTYPDLETSVLNLTVLSSKNRKKKHTFFSYLFVRSPNLQSEFEIWKKSLTPCDLWPPEHRI